MTIMVADDNSGFRKLLASTARAIDGIEVVGEAKNVPGAIAALRKTTPDAIILDIHMPGGTGFDVLRFATSRKPSPLVIVLTVGRRIEYEARCLQAGADYFFEKSSQLSQMLALLRKLAARSATGTLRHSFAEARRVKS